ncbi:hypothetical protein JZO70_00055 [Enterococcus sp. 669A]|uniref:Transposase n=1 Tax=Candidatus Enterococcus moelleringii TaxID=2815325 RepID=A0ABS3L7V2_9ENTE|nr:hypothetical protein [Enterococcus sp. 669A]
MEKVRKRTLELGHTPSAREFKQSQRAAIRYGNRNQFLEQAGLEIR